MLDRQSRVFAAQEVGVWARPIFAKILPHSRSDLSINDAVFLRDANVFVNGRWFPPGDMAAPAQPHIGLLRGKIAYVVVPVGTVNADDVERSVENLRGRLPAIEVGGQWFDFAWEVVDANGPAICEDYSTLPSSDVPSPANVAVIGRPESLWLAPTAQVDPFVAIDTRQGPVVIDEGAIVHSFTRLEGPCYVGKNAWLLGAKLRGGVIGPGCRIGGEVEASIVHGFSNKYHDGFLGHSYVGEWVNLAAGTQTSDIRNDYEPIRTSIAGQRVATKRNKVGSLVGDHVKTGLGAILNAGSVIGAFSNLLPSGTYLPQVVPSFCQARGGQLSGLWDLRKLFHTASTVMKRRGLEFTETHAEFFDSLYEETAGIRRRTLQEQESRRARRGVV